MEVPEPAADAGWGELVRLAPSVAPAVRHIDRTVEFLDLVTACHSFVAAVGRAVPGLRDRTLGEDERTIVHENVAKVRATLDWIETAVNTGKGQGTTARKDRVVARTADEAVSDEGGSSRGKREDPPSLYVLPPGTCPWPRSANDHRVEK